MNIIFAYKHIGLIKKNPRNPVYSSLKMDPFFKNPTVDMNISFMGCFFSTFLGLNSDRFYYNNASSKGTAIFCYIK